ncbi:hypothetical protein BL864_004930 [Escherichia coli]|nr:hypothetical protein [Escherichia coli]
MSIDSDCWSDFKILATLGAACTDSRSAQIFNEAVERQSKLGGIAISAKTSLRRSGARGRLMSQLRKLKYGGLVVSNAEDILPAARQIEGRVLLPKRDYLFNVRSDQSIDRETWNRAARISFAAEAVISEFILPVGERIRLFERSQLDQVRAEIEGGTLISFHHGGFASVRIAVLDDLFPNAIIMTNGIRKERRLNVSEAGGAALMIAARTLSKGGIVTLAPDGVQGEGGVTKTVAGVPVSFREGAAMLAHRSKARTVWLMTGRNDTSFEVKWRFGPQRTDDESYSDFRRRYFDFYAGCLDSFFTGASENLVFPPMWEKKFKG